MEVNRLFQETFGGEAAIQAFAPGRIEFIGNHTDYNRGLVMGAAVTEGITVALRRREDRTIRLVSDAGAPVEVSLDALSPRTGSASWANYPLGVVSVLRAGHVALESGFEMAVGSTLPAGAGMSSSAAFELATAVALGEAFSYAMDPVTLARVGRQAENDFVGMPCGILDQGVSAHGRPDHLVQIDCAREHFSLVPMPEGTHFWVFNSNEKHALIDSQYAERHEACQRALGILQRHFPNLQNLSQVTEAQLESAGPDLGDVLYRRSRHVVSENARVLDVARALGEGDLTAVGAALFDSHRSSRDDFENSIGALDSLVDFLGEQPAVYGARLTGGGFGGAVMALTSDAFGEDQARVVAEAFERRHGGLPTVLHTRAGGGARLLGPST